MQESTAGTGGSRYGTGIAIMVLVAMPISLLGASVVWWLDPAETAGLAKVIGLNAIPLYIVNLVPCVGVVLIVLRTRLTGGMLSSTRRGIRILLLSTFFGAAAAGLVGLLLVADVRAALYVLPHVVWGAANGAIFAVVFFGIAGGATVRSKGAAPGTD